MELSEAREYLEETEARYKYLSGKTYRDRTGAEREEMYKVSAKRYEAQDIVDRAEQIQKAMQKYGMTREEAAAKLTELTSKAGEALKEAEELAAGYALSFSVNSERGSFDFDGNYGQYEGWDSSSC